ncbi:hypothetical protein Btru_008559 [Bulinus truncatus]|nr:hypothetical protein Btru_008559 [Bulinus truncatus]
MSEGDLIDNDCDKLVDEERFNKEDDDGDGRVDEDVGNPPRANGFWGLWLSWQCDVKCGIGFSIDRKRYCDSPSPKNDGLECPGRAFESQQSLCNTNVTCPENCPVRTFGFNCTERCPRCVPDCNKVNGSCEICADGFSDPDNHCDKFCPDWTYGPRCSGNCKLKCHFDCIDRITGTCADILSFKEIIILVTLSPMVFAVVIVCVIKLKQTLDSSVTEETSSHVSESSVVMTSLQSSTLNTGFTATDLSSQSEF